MPEKKRVAVLFGGHSSEYGVSLQSAASVLEEIDRERFVPISIGISRQGDWYLYEGPIQAIREDAWQRGVGCAPVAFSPSRGGPALLSLEDGTPRGIAVDAAFPVLHGKDGEDGTVQGAELQGGARILARNVLVACGGVSYPGTGSTGDGYAFARQAGHIVTPLRPSLVPLVAAGTDCPEMMGLSLKNTAIHVWDTKKRKRFTTILGRCSSRILAFPARWS